MNRDKNKYVPTPDEIREACERIRDKWSHDEKQRRHANSRDAVDRLAEGEEPLDHPSSESD